MNVLLVSGFAPGVASAGGTRAYVESLSAYLARTGVPHRILTSGRSLQSAGVWSSVPVRETGSSLHWLAAMSANLKSLDIPKDCVVHVQRPDDLIPFIAAGVHRTLVCTIHGDPGQAIRERHSQLVSGAYAAMEAAVLYCTHRVLFADPRSARHYVEQYPWLLGRGEVIPNAVDETVFTLADRAESRLRWRFEGTVFLYAGRLHPEKRVPDIIRAFRGLGRDDCSLVIAGDGPDRKRAEAAASGARVRFLGTVPRQEMPSLLRASDALVLYSTREGLPSVVLEALASGIPVIATAAGSVPEVVRPRTNGFLVGSPSELKDAMEAIRSDEFEASPERIRGTALPYTWSMLGPKVVRAYAEAARVSQGTAPSP